MAANKGALLILGGLPGAGKTAIARALARDISAMHLRIDSIEQVLRSVTSPPLDDLGYRVAYAIAEDNLKLGQTVIADSVNPLRVTREAWLRVARGARAASIEIEIRCSDPIEHRRRIETRTADIPGMVLPGWADVLAREYEPWTREHVTIETAGRTIEECVKAIRTSLALARLH